jgi:uncharacterized RDD family membrane protein YckC
MNSLLFRRVLAFMIDYCIIISYAVLLFLASTLLKNSFEVNLNFDSPLKNQVLGFFSLTLPVFLYFFLSEKGVHKATLGKRILHLKVSAAKGRKEHLLLRNFLKFLPWEIAHMGVYHVVYYEQLEQPISIWIWCALIIPQVMVVGYFISCIRSKGQRSMYDTIAGTQLSLKS